MEADQPGVQLERFRRAVLGGAGLGVGAGLGKPVPAAVPLLTTEAIIVCRLSTTAAGSLVALAVVVPLTSLGACTVPVSTAAATIAMSSGDISTRPWPMDVAARSAPSLGLGTEPGYASRPRCIALPRRYWATASWMSASFRSFDTSPMNAVLQDSVKAWSIVRTGPSPSALWKTSPSSVIVLGQLAAEAGVSPCSISAVESRILNVEPGGKPPSTAAS